MFAFRLAAALLLPLCAAAVAQPVAAPVQTIQMHSYAYNPSPIHLATGRAVTLHFVNRSGKGHDFTAREFFASSRILAGSAPSGEVDLGPGQARSITLIPARGTYKVHCGHGFHKLLGMKSRIVVH